MKLYGRITSFNVQKVLWLLDELGLNYELVELGGRFGGLETENFQQLNPMKKVPVLIDGKRHIWESHTIMRYLIAEYSSQLWCQGSPYSQSLYERWMDWSQVTFQPAFMATFWGYYRMPPNKRDMNTVELNLARCKLCLKQIEVQLKETDYLAGSSMSLADICVGAVLYRLTTQGLSISLASNTQQWFDKLSKRPGYKTWIMSDYSELKGREGY
ncbi:putative glutathione S-transferase [Marinomonas sp. MED121]|uniref:glutathione S-transferase family protein n=1 Tax=Marinomonas sp. MED121 TaxID=314277 RepID=UPI0000690A4F|nr:glutathione S-transferase family protein [Marinomonas sp. MED121]EAQ64025.1 putative glutathione S-transferase [Marinomonas sp. MED121]